MTAVCDHSVGAVHPVCVTMRAHVCSVCMWLCTRYGQQVVLLASHLLAHCYLSLQQMWSTFDAGSPLHDGGGGTLTQGTDSLTNHLILSMEWS